MDAYEKLRLLAIFDVNFLSIRIRHNSWHVSCGTVQRAGVNLHRIKTSPHDHIPP
ncbi:hypothetical protein H4S14_000457 [Agrobacterium vitis]|nr:hypothetical protein [Agrobacterium vitis]MBE1436730.1 hypothetical protein [Agrobacterium vitis]